MLLNYLAGLHAVERCVKFVEMLRGKEHLDVLADYLFGTMPVHAFGAPIPTRNRPVELPAKDGVDGRVDDRGQQRRCV